MWKGVFVFLQSKHTNTHTHTDRESWLIKSVWDQSTHFLFRQSSWNVFDQMLVSLSSHTVKKQNKVKNKEYLVIDIKVFDRLEPDLRYTLKLTLEILKSQNF